MALQTKLFIHSWFIYSPFLNTVLAGRDFINFVAELKFFQRVSKRRYLLSKGYTLPL